MAAKNKTEKKDDKVEVNTKTTKFDTMLKVKLADEERMKFAKEMSEAHNRIAVLESNLNSMKKDMQAKIAIETATVNRLSGVVASGEEYRMVKCDRVFNYKTGRVTETRTDGQEPAVIGDRNMTEEEKQAEFAFQE